MDVAVTTTVRNAAGKTTKTSHSTVHVLFKGYSLRTHHFSFQGNSGWFSTGSLRDSFSGNFAAFMAAGMIADPPEGAEVRVEPGLVSVRTMACKSTELMEQYPIPKHFCGTVSYRLGADTDGGPVFEHFTLDLAGLPARAKLAYLGEVEISGYRIDGDFQKALLPGDPKPFLLPGKIVTSITTNKGNLESTNDYSPHPPKK